MPWSKEQANEYYRMWSKKNPNLVMKKKWKSRGVILRENEDWDSIYLFYITCSRCELCNIELTNQRNSGRARCLDHDHKTGFIRNIICQKCNVTIEPQDRDSKGRFT